ncbi:MAG: hypothetical protein ACOY3N_23410 [Bradyrhizobium sp.]|uniref:hypothetical protein n=1 Tax=Bradyrhizobium sp. TaxID=376 RepID=UPI003BEFEAB6
MNFPMRDYDDAMKRLESLQRYLGEGPVTDRLAALQISIAPAKSPGVVSAHVPSEFVEGVEKLIRADLQRYGARLIQAAQDEVRKAAAALRASIDADLKSNLMRD